MITAGRSDGAEIEEIRHDFGVHYGQIVYVPKQLRGQDLGFYRELDQTGRLPEA